MLKQLDKAPDGAVHWMSTADRARTALHFAVDGGHLHCIAALLDQNADMMWTDLDGISALSLAVASGQTECLTLLLSRCEDRKEEIGRALLTLAAELASADCLTLILDAFPNVDINSIDSQQMTAVLSAVEAGSAECFLKLVDNGADLTACNQQGVPVLHLAAYSGVAECARAVAVQLAPSALLKHDRMRGWTPLLWAVLSGDCATVGVILDAKGSPPISERYFFKDTQGASAMHVAAAGGCSEVSACD